MFHGRYNLSPTIGDSMTVYIAPLGSGLGDVIVTLPLLYKSIEQSETYLVARSPRQEGLTEAIKGLTGTIREPDLAKIELRGGDRYLNLRAHRLQTDYVWGGPEFARDYPDFRINDILRVISADYGFDADFDTRIAFDFAHRPEFGGKVLIVPGTTTASKTWSVSLWLELIGALAGAGRSACMLGEPERSAVVFDLIEHGVEWIRTPTIQNAIDIISSAMAVVSVDTGLMHIAVQQGAPTVALFQGSALYYRKFPNCFPVFANSCSVKCMTDPEPSSPNTRTEYKAFEWFDGSFGSCAADPGTGCMDSIAPAMVVAKLNGCT